MAQIEFVKGQEGSLGAPIIAWIGRILLAFVIPLIAFAVLYVGFIFLRDSHAPRWIIISVAIVWGVGGVALLYWVFNGIVEQLPVQWTSRLQPFVVVGPANSPPSPATRPACAGFSHPSPAIFSPNRHSSGIT